MQSTFLSSIQNARLRSNLSRRGILALCPNQQAAIEGLRNKHDIVLNTESATGKTLSVILGAVDGLDLRRASSQQDLLEFEYTDEVRNDLVIAQNKWVYSRRRQPRLTSSSGDSETFHAIKPVVVIICPTYENAEEVLWEAIELFDGTPIFPGIVHGQLEWFATPRMLRTCDFLIATPGRLMDYAMHGYIDFSNLQLLVLDEFLTLLSETSSMSRQLNECFFSQEPDRWHLTRDGASVQRMLVDAAHGLAYDPRRGNWLRSASDKTACEEAFSNCKLLMAKEHLRDHRKYNFIEIASVAEFEAKAAEYISNVLKDGRKAIVFTTSTKKRAARLADYIRAGLCTPEIGYDDRVHYLTEDARPHIRRKVIEKIRVTEGSVVVGCRLLGHAVNIPGLYHIFLVGVPGAIWDFHSRASRCGRDGNDGEVHTIFTQCQADEYENYLSMEGFAKGKGAQVTCGTFPAGINNISRLPRAGNIIGPDEHEQNELAAHAKFLVLVQQHAPSFVSCSVGGTSTKFLRESRAAKNSRSGAH